MYHTLHKGHVSSHCRWLLQTRFNSVEGIPMSARVRHQQSVPRAVKSSRSDGRIRNKRVLHRSRRAPTMALSGAILGGVAAGSILGPVGGLAGFVAGSIAGDAYDRRKASADRRAKTSRAR